MSATTTSKSAIDPALREPIQWVQENSRVLSLAGAVIVALLLGAYLFVRSAQIKVAKAEEAYNESQQLFYSGKATEGAVKMADAARRYVGTNAGTMAAMRLAVYSINERKMGEAIAVLRQAEPKANKKIFGTALHGLLAAALSDSGLYAMAGDEYLLSAKASRVESEQVEINYKAAEMFANGGSKDRAVQLLATLVDGPPSDTRGKARKLMGELQTAPAKVGGG